MWGIVWVTFDLTVDIKVKYQINNENFLVY